MAFLTKEELKTAIRMEKLTRITDADDLIIQYAISAAITEVKSRITANGKKSWMDGRLRYDVDRIFGETGENRNALIHDITKITAIWRLLTRSNAGVDYEVIAARYEFGVGYLKDLATGEANDGTLPLLPDVDPNSTSNKDLPFRMGSRTKFNHE